MMKFSANLNWLPAIAMLWLAFAIGCASPGPPEPPSLHLPGIVADLSAQRVGNAVALHWTTPSRTTDDLEIKGPVTAEVCREARPSSRASACVPVQKLTVTPGATETTDPLPATLTRDPAMLLLYRVRLFNANSRTAGPSPVAYAASGAAPPPVQQLHAAATRSGILIEWTAGPAFVVDLDRTLIAKPVLAPAKPANNTSQPAPRHHANLSPATPAEIHLQTGDASSDSGGTLDRNAQKRVTYRYTAQRVRSIVLAGHALELRSDPSLPITVTLTDTFPPAAPTGLAAIPGTHSIDLSWEPVPDSDLAGYIVYRQPAAPAGASSQRLTVTPITGPAFSDQTAVPGQSYSYRVTAIDTTGNQSMPSVAVEQTMPEPQP